jgi:cystathionine beta-lyase
MTAPPPEPTFESGHFDRVFDRTSTSATKWQKYAGQDVLPFWIADMDFATPAFIHQAIAERLEHPILGYTNVPEPLYEQACEWLYRAHGWRVPPEWLVWLPGVVPGLNLAARATLADGGSLVVPTPVYYPFREVAHHQGVASTELPLVKRSAGGSAEWRMDFDAMAQRLPQDAQLLLLCNPQNPTGRAYTQAELQELITFCQVHNLALCSDEIHSQLLLDESATHIPIASLDSDFAEQTISLFAPTKTYNMPGLSSAFAVIPNASLRQRFRDARGGMVSSPSVLAYAAASAAFTDTGNWRTELLSYLRTNHGQWQSLVQAELPGRATPVQATYLAWLDLTEFGISDTHAYFLKHGLGLSDGAAFGSPGFARFNFACPAPVLERGLERLQAALRALTKDH